MQKKIQIAYNKGLNSGADTEEDNPYDEFTEEAEAWHAGCEDKFRLAYDNFR